MSGVFIGVSQTTSQGRRTYASALLRHLEAVRKGTPLEELVALVERETGLARGEFLPQEFLQQNTPTQPVRKEGP